MKGTSFFRGVGVDGLLLAKAVVKSCIQGHSEHGAQTLGCKRSERLERDCKVSANLQTDVQNCCTTAHIGLRNLPRLGVGDIFVAHTSNRHRILESLTEMICVEILLKRSLELRNLSKSLLVHIEKLPACRHLTLKILVSQDNCTVDKVSENRNELAVVACLEVLPRKVIILGFRSIGSEDISHHILFSRELLKIFMSPYGPAP